MVLLGCVPARTAPAPSTRSSWSLHDLDRLLDADAASEVLTALHLLAEEHLPIHIHANNYARVVRFGSYWFPKAVEVSWVHRRAPDVNVPGGGTGPRLGQAV